MPESAIARPRHAPLALLALTLGLAPPFVTAAPADDVKALFERGESRQAFELGRKTPEALGQPLFDYYYGMAAIDAGRVGDGVLALERYLLNNPGSVSARLELGRGYFLMGDNQRAREMFDEVRKLAPPPEAERRIEGYLAAIREKESGYKVRASGFVELGAGHDSNVNGGISQESINIPLLGPVLVDASGREIADRFWSIAAGGQLNVPVAPGVALFGGIALENRAHREAEFFDQRSVGGAAGVSVKRGENQFRASVSASALDVDGERYRSVKAGTFEWSRNLGARTGFGLFAQAADVAYKGDNRVRDSRLYAGGASWRHSIEGRWQPFLSAVLTAGHERNEQDRDDLARNLVGVRLSAGLTMSPNWNAALAAGWQESRYQDTDPFFGVRRKDRNLSFEAAVGYLLTRSLGLRLELSYADNSSNVELFEYDRLVAALKLRYDFK